MRIPSLIIEHPVEGPIAGLLLLALLFGSADPSCRESRRARPAHAQIATAQKM